MQSHMVLNYLSILPIVIDFPHTYLCVCLIIVFAELLPKCMSILTHVSSTPTPLSCLSTLSPLTSYPDFSFHCHHFLNPCTPFSFTRRSYCTGQTTSLPSRYLTPTFSSLFTHYRPMLCVCVLVLIINWL